jgi:hypothetical protein
MRVFHCDGLATFRERADRYWVLATSVVPKYW